MSTPDRPRPPKVAIVTLGCGRNEVDSDNTAGQLAAAGFELAGDPEHADAILVNTCAFIRAAKQESIDTVLGAAALKQAGRARAVLVMGCLAERYTDQLRAELPEADAVVPFADYARLPGLLAERLGLPQSAAAAEPPPVQAARAPGGPAVAAAGGLAVTPPAGRRAPARPRRSSRRSPGWWRTASPRSAWSPRTPPPTARTCLAKSAGRLRPATAGRLRPATAGRLRPATAERLRPATAERLRPAARSCGCCATWPASTGCGACASTTCSPTS
jgi:hypothetical protein